MARIRRFSASSSSNPSSAKILASAGVTFNAVEATAAGCPVCVAFVISTRVSSPHGSYALSSSVLSLRDQLAISVCREIDVCLWHLPVTSSRHACNAKIAFEHCNHEHR
jgi:hypothetical protein